jgi:anti-anti-sigma factor
MSRALPNSVEHSNGRVLVGLKGEEVFLEVHGRGTHLVSQPLRECLTQMMDKGVRNFRMNLGDCSYFDSTFLGVLAGACLKLQNMGASHFVISSITPRNLSLMETLGIAGFFEFIESSGEEARPEQLYPLTGGIEGESQTRTVLEAHRTLACLDEKNAARFKDVIECLEQELGRTRAANP